VIATGEEISPAEALGTIQILWDIFGGTVNEKGYKILSDCIGCISGEGWNLEKLNEVFRLLEKKGFASINLAVGLGSYGYTYCTRDSYGMAMKATWGQVNGVPRDIFKSPKTDGAFTKKSAKGLLRVERENGKYVLYDQQTIEEESRGELKEVFRDGKLLIDTSLAEIRTRIDNQIEQWIKTK
jgi:nicotinamide phosphoribosyltransferase